MRLRLRRVLACMLFLAVATACDDSRLIPGDDTLCNGPDDCDADDYCESDCHALGFCRNQPSSCPTTVAPVCGCNDNTYDNECLAHKDGTDVDHDGAC